MPWVWVWWVIDVVVMPWVWWVIGFGSCRGCRFVLCVWVCAVVFMDLAMVGHRFHGFMGYAVGFVLWVVGIVVMLWVWWVIGFGSCRGFPFCGCGLILVVVMVG